MRTSIRRPVGTDDSVLANRIGSRLKEARRRAGLTQQQLAGDRYTKAYVSALENGLVRPSMVALDFLSERLNIPPSRLIADDTPLWSRLEADLHLAASRWVEAADGYTRLLDETSAPETRAELLRGRAEARARLNDGLAAAADAADAARIFTAAGREADAMIATYWLANAQYEQGNNAEARALLQMILGRLRAGLTIEPDFELRVLMALSTVESREGEHARALGYLEEVRGAARGLDDRRRATYLFDLAYSYRETGDLEGAIRTGHESLALFRASGSDFEMAALENDMALAYLALRNLPRATELCNKARARFEQLGDLRWLSHVEDTAAQIALAEGRPQAALDLTDKAIAAAEQTGNQKALLGALVTRARANVELGDVGAATACFEQATEIARASGPRAWLRDVLGQWAELLASHGQHERAYALTREALSAG
jgi:transcriptional regulator with XRE-family HTH domain